MGCYNTPDTMVETVA